MHNGAVCHESYAFINFFFEGDEKYDEIILESTSAGSNFASDNHTFSTEEQEITGVIIPPEPDNFAD